MADYGTKWLWPSKATFSPPAFTCSSKTIFWEQPPKWHSLSTCKGPEALKQPQSLWQGRCLWGKTLCMNSLITPGSRNWKGWVTHRSQISVAKGGMGMEGEEWAQCFSQCPLLKPLTAPERFANRFWAERLLYMTSHSCESVGWQEDGTALEGLASAQSAFFKVFPPPS